MASVRGPSVRGAAICGVGLLGLLAPQPARAGEAAAFLITTYMPSGPSAVGERASLALQGTSFATSLQADIEGGGGQTGFAGAAAPGWTGTRTALTASWTPASAISLDIDLSNTLKRAFTQVDPLVPSLPAALTNTASQSAKVSASMAPADGLTLKVGGEATSDSVQTPAYGALGVLTAASDLRNQSARAFADVTWKPLPMFSLDAGESLQSLGVSATAPGEDGATYSYVTPRVVGTLTPWDGASLSLSAENAVTAPNAAQFASFVQVAGRPGLDAFQPERAWRYVAGMKQTVGPVAVSASYTLADLRSVTDLGPVAGVQAPIDIGAGRRRSLDLAVSAPLAVPGFAPLKLDASGTWLTSQVIDPFTGERRPVSGDAAYKAELNLSGDLRLLPVSWTLKANVTGPSAVWQMSQVDQLSPTAGLGASFAYSAGPVKLGLQLDNLVGGDRTDTSVLYAGSRAFGVQDGQRETRQDDRAVRFTISRSL
jgi:hypothetical protein